MTIKCPYCGAVYDIEENECGCRARCEVCGKCFVIGHAPQRIQEALGARAFGDRRSAWRPQD